MNVNLTKNEVLELMHESTAYALRKLADHFDKFKDEYTIENVVSYLREIADEQEAQTIVIQLRDNIL